MTTWNFAVLPEVPATRLALTAVALSHSTTEPQSLAPEWKPIAVRLPRVSFLAASSVEQFLL